MRTVTFNPFLLIIFCCLLLRLPASAQPDQSSTTNEPAITTTLTNTGGANAGAGHDEKLKALRAKIRLLAQDPNRSWTEYEQVGRELIAEFPEQPDGYDALLAVMQMGDPKRAKLVAEELTNSSAPEEYRLFAKGFIYRKDLYGKPVALKFQALDGRAVDLSQMRGKVVLIDFWATGCVPCVEALPEITAVYDKYHDQGFEVVGISFDTDKEDLARFIKERGLHWPESFDGAGFLNNKFGLQFGVRAIPHTLIIDKKGCLVIDSLYIPHRLEGAVTNLLAQP